MKQSQGVAGLFDRLVSAAFASDQETLFRARILAGIVVAYIVILMVTIVYMVYFAQLSWLSMLVAGLLQLAMVTGYAYVLRQLKYGDNYPRCIELTVFFTYLGIVVGIALSGGPINAPATPMMVIPVIVAFSLSTRSSGLFWSTVVFLSHMALIAIDRWVFAFPQLLESSQLTTQHVAHWVVTYCAIIFLMLIFESITRRLKEERDAERDRYAYLAAHDPLTGLSNRGMFDAQLTRALANSDRNKNIVGLMIIDLDGFKPVNDRYGHDAGDLVLRTIAARLQALLRKTDTVARMGGDEFAVILENVMSPPGVGIVAERIIAEINRPYEGLPAGARIGASIGIAMYPEHAAEEDQLRRLADRAMYEAKSAHNCFRVYDPSMGE